MLSIGIVGLPNVGKSTLFKALTKNPVDISNYPFCTIDPNVGIVKVPDKRLDKLTRQFSSKKTIPTIVEFHDIAGLVKDASKGEGLGNAFLSHIRRVDAICEVVRCFKTGDIVHVEGSVDPKRDMEIIHLELILADLELVAKALSKANSDAKSGKPDTLKRRDALDAIHKWLEAEKLLSVNSWSKEEIQAIRELNLLTIKPFLIAFNLSEEDIREDRFEKIKEDQENLLKKEILDSRLRGNDKPVFIASKFEQELSELTPEETLVYRQEFKVSERYKGLEELIAKAYETLNLLTFITTGEDETRAWTVTKGSTAPQAGGKIHGDFEQKFIRAEVIPWDTLLDCGSWAKAREQGKLHTVGRDYVVKDGDVIEIKI